MGSILKAKHLTSTKKQGSAVKRAGKFPRKTFW